MAYFPNATAGSVLDSQCSKCPMSSDESLCPVHAVQLTYNYEQVGNDKMEALMNMLIDDKGHCQVFEILFEKMPPDNQDGGTCPTCGRTLPRWYEGERCC